jgi:hypothetical protein
LIEELHRWKGGSKQAAHKLASAAIASLRDRLAAMGYHGVDTMGFLKSMSRPVDDRRPEP